MLPQVKGAKTPCNKIIDDATCDKDDACAWHADVFICWNKGESPPCTAYFDETACNARDDCVFRNNDCQV